MNDIRSLYFRHLQGRLGSIAYQLTRVQFSSFSALECWRPAVNVYRCAKGFLICVDLAGVDRSQIELTLEPERLLIRGRRQALEPDLASGPPVQILALEIDTGPFEREIIFPAGIDPGQAHVEQREGILRIHLPFQSPARTAPSAGRSQ